MNMEQLTQFMSIAGLSTLAGAALAVAIILGIVFYVFFAITHTKIGKRLKVEPTWLAWIPIANAFYIPMLAGYEWYFGFLWLIGVIPVVGGLIALVINIWWYWKIAERLKKPGALSLLYLIPGIGPLILWGILAWSK